MAEEKPTPLSKEELEEPTVPTPEELTKGLQHLLDGPLDIEEGTTFKPKAIKGKIK